MARGTPPVSDSGQSRASLLGKSGDFRIESCYESSKGNDGMTTHGWEQIHAEAIAKNFNL